MSKWGIDLDVLVRCRGSYMPATKISTGSSIAVELPGLSEGYDVSGFKSKESESGEITE